MPAVSGDLRPRAERLPWYHTLELPGGVVTRGYYDLRGVPAQLPLPASLEGKRCLDAATANGFWAFELERRGAEVVGIDVDPAQLDWPGGPPATIDEQYRTVAGFELARDALGSRVQREHVSIYDVTPERLGRFDLVFIGSVLLHLRDPVGALSALRGVVRGELLSLDVVSLSLSLLSRRWALASLSRRDEPRWWTPNRMGHLRWLEAAGLEVVSTGTLRQPFGALLPRRPAGPKPGEIAFALGPRRFGVPSQWALARPAP
jgi:tRNA (mo5U34)-methyltransferase